MMDDQSHIACSHCNYNLTGIDLSGHCPECGTKIIKNCFRCDYQIVDIDPYGPCPECGFPIQHSIGQGELARWNPETVARIHNGVFVIQATVIVWILNIFTGAILGAVAGANMQPISPSVNIALTTVVIGVACAFVYGWWRFSSFDQEAEIPSAGVSANRFLKVTLSLFVFVSILNVASNFLPQSFYNTVGGSIAAIVFFLLVIVVFITSFISQLLYLRWFSPLILNKKAFRRSKTLLWLGPILMTFGILILIGPLIAIIMYWNMLDWIRKDLKTIRQSHHAIA